MDDIKSKLALDAFQDKISFLMDKKLSDECCRVYGSFVNEYNDYKHNIMNHNGNVLIPIDNIITHTELLKYLKTPTHCSAFSFFIRRELKEMLGIDKDYNAIESRLNAFDSRQALFLIKRYYIFFNNDAINDMIYTIQKVIYK